MKTCSGAQVDEGVRQARRDELTSLQQDIGQEVAQALVGQEVPPSWLGPLCSSLLRCDCLRMPYLAVPCREEPASCMCT